jgi:hypothetical protein
MDSGSGRRTTIVSTCCAVAGGIGAVACSLSMALAALGIIGTAAAASGSTAGMEGMGSGSSGQTASSGRFGSLIRFLVQIGPPLLIISVAAITVSLGLRRRAAVIPAVLAGAVMYAGMYLQSAVPLMYGSIAVGLIVWTLLYVWTQRRQQRLRPDGTEGQAA